MVLNPKCDIEDRQKWTAALETWAKLEICPLEDPDHRHNQKVSAASAAETGLASSSEAVEEEELAEYKGTPIVGPIYTSKKSSKNGRGKGKPRTIFHKALDALLLDWTDPHLVNILNKADKADHLWQEHIPTACARIDALKTHGYEAEALRLAVTIAKTMRQNQALAHSHWVQNSENFSRIQWTASGVARKPAFASYQGWVGHALNPMGCLFNTLLEPCLLPDDKSRLGHHLDLGPTDPDSSTSSSSSNASLKYYHQPLSATDSCVVLAVEAALIALGQQRLMPAGLYAQEKAVKQEQRLIAKLQELELDSILQKVHARQAGILLDMGPSSGLGFGIHPESIPMQTFAKYLFHTLLPHDQDLAFKVGLRAMRMPILDEMEKEELPALAAAVAQHEHRDGDPEEHPLLGNHPPSSYVMNRLPRWFTIGHIESQQCALASRMLNAAKGTP